MQYRLPLSLFAVAALALPVLLGGCAQTGPEPGRPVKTNAKMVADIQAAGARDNSVINIKGLRDPGVDALQQGAQNDERNGLYQAAAGRLDQALKSSPDAPDLLQDRAEVAIYLSDYPTAEKLARQSWEQGSKLGSVCARNWQTILEIRQHANDDAGVVAARNGLQQCEKAGVPRY